eukprot:123372-Prymnesium_polylepis.1
MHNLAIGVATRKVFFVRANGRRRASTAPRGLHRGRARLASDPVLLWHRYLRAPHRCCGVQGRFRATKGLGDE